MTHLPRRWTGILLICILFLSALLPRLCAVDRYVTPDELNWVHRSVQFREALIDGRWADTLVAGHPGVTTTWAGVLGISLQLAVRPADSAVYRWITHLAWLSPDLIPAFPRLASLLTSGRLVVAIATSLGVVAAYFLVRSLFGRRAALVAGFFLAFDPFLAGLSGLLHVDGLVATFSTLSLLFLADAQRWRGSQRRRVMLAAAGSLSALGVMTKSPAALLIPLTGLVLALAMFDRSTVDGSWRRRLSLLAADAAFWVAAFLVTAFLVLPAMWVAPGEVLDTVLGAVNRHAGDALRPTFFLGQVQLEHGPLYYPLVLLFRLGPLTLLGLVIGVVLLLRRNGTMLSRPVITLLLWAGIFVMLITPAAKKFDRYALPTIVPLDVVAAVGWVALAGDMRRLKPALSYLLIAVQALLLFVVLPFPLTSFNPLVGGEPAAASVMAVDWGEGIGAAGRWLAAQPDAAGATATAINALALSPFFPGRTVPFDAEQIAQADYVVLDVNARQIDPAGFDEMTGDATLRKVIRLGGVDHAWIYQQMDPEEPAPPVPELESAYLFGDRVQLLGASGRATSDWADLTVRWGLLSPGGRYTVQLTLRDCWGHIWGQSDTPLLNEVHFYPEHWEAGERPEVRYRIGLPAGIPPSEYAWELSLYDGESGARLPLVDSQGRFHGVVFRYEGVSVPIPTQPPSLGELAVPVRAGASWLDGALVLLGHDVPTESLLAGEGADFELYWHSLAALPDGLLLKVALGETVDTVIPLSRSPSGQWQKGGLIREKYTLTTPPELASGSYQLRIAPMDADGTLLEGPFVTLGTIQVNSPDRLFELPAGIEYSLDYRLEDGIRLRGLAVATRDVTPGRQVRLTLFWQAENRPAGLYTAFVHLVGPDGSEVAQDDHWPAFLPSNTWAAGQVVVDEYAIALPESAPAGQYLIATGLYDASTGLRVTMWEADGVPVPDDRAIMPATISVSDSHE